MTYMTFKDENGKWRRVSKPMARKLFDMGKKLILAPCKANPLSPWGIGVTISKKDESFDKVCNSFEYYNCGGELGKYAAFYVEV